MISIDLRIFLGAITFSGYTKRFINREGENVSQFGKSSLSVPHNAAGFNYKQEQQLTKDDKLPHVCLSELVIGLVMKRNLMK